MSLNLTINIRKVENGFVATFGREHPGEQGDEFAALAPADLRATVAAEVEARLADMIDKFSKS